MTCCTIKGCHNASHHRKKEAKITFHSFPSNPIHAAQWIKIVRMNRSEECWKPTKYTKICSEHFEDSEKYITEGGFCKLRQGAVPTKGLHINCREDSLRSNNRDLNKTPMGASSNETYTNSSQINCNEVETLNEPIEESQKYDTDLDSIFDSPCKSALLKQLAKKNALQRKQSKIIKLLQQKIRRLKKKNISLQKIVRDLKNKRFIDNDNDAPRNC